MYIYVNLYVKYMNYACSYALINSGLELTVLFSEL